MAPHFLNSWVLMAVAKGRGVSAESCPFGHCCPCGQVPPRQRQVLHRLLLGDCEKQAAAALGISIHTVHGYAKRLCRHFKVSGRCELMALVLRGAIFGPDPSRGGAKGVIELSSEQREELLRLASDPRRPRREIARAQVLLRCAGGSTNAQAARSASVSVRTVERVRRLFLIGGLDGALHRRAQPPRPAAQVLLPKAERQLRALLDQRPPTGYGKWSNELLAARMVQLGHVPALSRETVRRVLIRNR